MSGAVLGAVLAASLAVGLGCACTACTKEPPRPPSHGAPARPREPREAVVVEPTKLVGTAPIRVSLRSLRGAQLYLPSWFRGRGGGYDLIVHFHGLGKIQESNVEQVKLNAAVVSINLGAGTTPYGKAFKNKELFGRLLAEVDTEIEASGRAPDAELRRLALSAWSAGYVSVAKVLADPAVAEKVDAVLLADGFFTSFTNPKKRVVNEAGIKPMARLAEAAEKDEKLFAITHTTIPTGSFPSVQECVAKLLAMVSLEKQPSNAVGPREMREIYAVDRGSFHVHGFEGRTAHDHVSQIHAMGETLYPYLKARWDKQDEDSASASPAAAPAAASEPAE